MFSQRKYFSVRVVCFLKMLQGCRSITLEKRLFQNYVVVLHFVEVNRKNLCPLCFRRYFQKSGHKLRDRVLEPWQTMFAQNAMCTATLNEESKFHCAMSILSRIIFTIGNIHWCFSTNTISCYVMRFAQIEMYSTHDVALQPSRYMFLAQ